jgi:hypothetical protein
MSRSEYRQLAQHAVPHARDGVNIRADGVWFSAPLDDLIHASHDPLGGQRKALFYAQSLTVKVIEHVQQSDRPPICKLIRHEIYRPVGVWRIRHGQRFGKGSTAHYVWKKHYRRNKTSTDAWPLPWPSFAISFSFFAANLASLRFISNRTADQVHTFFGNFCIIAISSEKRFPALCLRVPNDFHLHKWKAFFDQFTPLMN